MRSSNFMHIVDRRLNPGGKNLANRQRFMRRAKALVRKAVHESLRRPRHQGCPGRAARSRIPPRACTSRASAAAEAACATSCCPATRSSSKATSLPRPGERRRRARRAGDGEGEDDFRFVLSRDEFVDLFLEDLELPDLAKRKLAEAESEGWQPRRLFDLRLAGQPRAEAHDATSAVAPHRAAAAEARRRSQQLEAEIAALRRTRSVAPSCWPSSRRCKAQVPGAFPIIDPLDVRYRRFETEPKPVAQAVMFCLMDVSGSMTEHMKDLAKRFYMLLYIFLKRRYKHVDIVFIRHTDEAAGGGRGDILPQPGDRRHRGVHRAGGDAARSSTTRYRPADWNIYAAQASDGDNIARRQRADRRGC